VAQGVLRFFRIPAILTSFSKRIRTRNNQRRQKMTANYKQLAEDLYKTLEEVSDFIDFDKFPLPIAEKLDRVLKEYEQETTRGDKK
jgi:hypothetical protein